MSTVIVSNEGYANDDGTFEAGFEVEPAGSFSFGEIFSATVNVVKKIAAVQQELARETDFSADQLKLDGDVLVHVGGENDREHIVVYRAEQGMFHDLNFGWVWYEVDPLDCKRVFTADGGERGQIDYLLDKYEAELQRIYDERTAGDYTFVGVLASMVNEMRVLGVQID